jgi:hypothetical protein
MQLLAVQAQFKLRNFYAHKAALVLQLLGNFATHKRLDLHSRPTLFSLASYKIARCVVDARG